MTIRRTLIAATAIALFAAGISAPSFANASKPVDETDSYIQVVNALVDAGVDPVDEPIDSATDGVGRLAVFGATCPTVKTQQLVFSDGAGGKRVIQFNTGCNA